MRRLLIANRGEIACRVMATARSLGIYCIAVYSEPDRQARHVRMADEAVLIGPAQAAESYLNHEAILSAARQTHADAIHPGYGFLSENALFARACEQAGIRFVGPSADAIAAMGDKRAAKALMQAAGVPLVPGYHGDDQSPDRLLKEAGQIGFPVMIKAAAGGGGKGMRIVGQATGFRDALDAVQREARTAFGDDQVLLERYLARPRHIEVQIFADQQGQCVHLFERDCSIQRRHQKVIEEAPAPGLNETLRQALGEAAVRAARAIQYEGAGTVEFLLDANGQFFFMEMNTRLQVEHPVTEMITGVDLVEWQLQVADGNPLPLDQAGLHHNGHAIEVRLYAEDPDRDFLPATGIISALEWPALDKGMRIDTGICAGDSISPWYDPMVAKLIAHGRNREEAANRMVQMLSGTCLAGIETNRGWLRRVLQIPAWRNAALHTGFLDEQADGLMPETGVEARMAAVATLADHLDVPHESIDPWDCQDGWRMHKTSIITRCWVVSGHHFDVLLCRSGAHWTAKVAVQHQEDARFDMEPQPNDSFRFSDGLVCRTLRLGKNWYVQIPDQSRVLERFDPLSQSHDDDDTSGLGLNVRSPMFGRVVSVPIVAGQLIEKGDCLVVVEAMKMEHRLTAVRKARVVSIDCMNGDQVEEGAILVELEEV